MYHLPSFTVLPQTFKALQFHASRIPQGKYLKPQAISSLKRANSLLIQLVEFIISFLLQEGWKTAARALLKAHCLTCSVERTWWIPVGESGSGRVAFRGQVQCGSRIMAWRGAAVTHGASQLRAEPTRGFPTQQHHPCLSLSFTLTRFGVSLSCRAHPSKQLRCSVPKTHHTSALDFLDQTAHLLTQQLSC